MEKIYTSNDSGRLKRKSIRWQNTFDQLIICLGIIALRLLIIEPFDFIYSIHGNIIISVIVVIITML